VYGSHATKEKTYIGKVTNYFSKISVAEILVETGELSVGDDILIIGPNTGAIEMTVPEVRVDLNPVKTAVKGVYCSIPLASDVKLHRSEKVYAWRDKP
ncbi:MAG: U32 family peptidase, partial [Bacteroidales bacterium]